MAKNFQFKLTAVLKLRHFKEDAIKLELGGIVSEMEKIKNKLSELDHNIEMGHKEIERLSTTTILAGQLSFYPMYLEGLRADVKRHMKFLEAQEKKYQECLGRLAKAMGDVKVMENLKEKEKFKFKRAAEKKMQLEIEESFAGQLHYKKGLMNILDGDV